ncbi:MAG: hypothetical protein ACREIH_04630 [Nitrospiraceae bacterium]
MGKTIDLPGLVLFTVAMGLAVSACGQAAKLLARANLEEARPVSGILSSQHLLAGTITALVDDQIHVNTGDGQPTVLSKEAGGEEARELRLGDPVEILVNDQNLVVAYQRPGALPPTKIFRGSLSQAPRVERERVVVRLETDKDISLYVTPDAMSKLGTLEIGESADFALDRTYRIVDIQSQGKPREGSSSKSVHRRIDGTYVVMGEGKMRLRTRSEGVISLPVRPLFQPAIEQLSPNEAIAVFLDADGYVIDMARIGPAPQTK